MQFYVLSCSRFSKKQTAAAEPLIQGKSDRGSLDDRQVWRRVLPTQKTNSSMAAKHPDPLYNCEICGEEGLTEEDMRSHMLVTHIEGAISCPFCDLGDISADEMLYHVNTLHLDFLGPVNDNAAISPDSWDDDISDNSTYNNNISNHNSPLRSELKLNLNPPKIKKSDCSPTKSEQMTMCPLCNYGNASLTKLQEHINRQHFDLTSPSFPEFINLDRSGSMFLCPLCNQSLETIPDLELHVNMDHRDVLSPMKSAQVTPSDENCNECCPVCSKSNFRSSVELASHIEDHFADGKSPNGLPPTPKTPRIALFGEAQNSDHLLALEMEKREREEQRQREQKEFRQLQAQYGMDNQGNFREQSITNMQRAVYAGEMSVADYYNRQMELRNAERDGIDDGNSCTKGLIPRIRAFSLTTSSVERIWLCTTVDHYCSTYGDRGWGCGYRNIQMILSSLIHHTGYNHCIFNGRNSIPSISKMQELIEGAWRLGFDAQGCEQLGGRLFNTRKWIGATEVVTFLSYFHVRCSLIDCHQPTGPNGTHPEMFEWVKEYFLREETFKSPIYLQHHGHSRTIIGLEELKDGSLQLIVLDPSHSRAQMEQFSNTATNTQAMRLIRRPLAALKARQYQLVAIDGILQNDKDYQESKVLRSYRLPPDN